MRRHVSPVFSASASPATGADDTLPAWDLSDLYPGPDSTAVAADFAAAEAAATAFETQHAGRLADLSGAALALAIGEYERIDEILGRLS
ncbi:MAG TPA: oligoendopeptidase F, partial [Acetobacteraceae bacterium]|nr:oligoendopeptidase F [Acetobacteraceae bacterium]